MSYSNYRTESSSSRDGTVAVSAGRDEVDRHWLAQRVFGHASPGESAMTTEQQDPETALPKRRSIAAGLPSRPRPSLSTTLEQYGLVIFLVVLIVFFAVWPKTSGTFPHVREHPDDPREPGRRHDRGARSSDPVPRGPVRPHRRRQRNRVHVHRCRADHEGRDPRGTELHHRGRRWGADRSRQRDRRGVPPRQRDRDHARMATLLGGLVILYSKSNSITGIPTSLINFGAKNWPVCLVRSGSP